ncbi:MAG: hypothetical protein NTX50_24085 [Candidatus Sumerlaeota bacterium]|nr:hypothetical protein [Candidatus Sumerlaeota bacterium]
MLLCRKNMLSCIYSIVILAALWIEALNTSLAAEKSTKPKAAAPAAAKKNDSATSKSASAAKPTSKDSTPKATSKDSAAKKTKEDEKDKLREVYKKVGKFIVCMTRDDKGCVWGGTEDDGVFRFDPEAAAGKEWTQFTRVKTGGKAEPSTMGAVMREPGDSALGDDNAYAIACDKLGRIWVGTLNHGVSVYNGESWRTYDRLDGPLGERIFDIAVCPTNGDVWIASSLGLARYSASAVSSSQFSVSGSNDGDKEKPSPSGSAAMKTENRKPKTENYELGRWRYYIRAAEATSLDKYPPSLTAHQTANLIECLPEDQCSSLAFDKDGNLYVGTQCHGLAIASAKDDYKSWRFVRAPERFGKDKTCSLPLDAEGDGLPSNLINQILVASDSVIWVGTTCGLAWSEDGGKNFTFRRGKDYTAKIKGLYGGAPKGWKEAPKSIMDRLLPEDYITCLAEDAEGRIWVGTRRAGFCIVSALSRKPIPNLDEKSYLTDNYISSIQPMPDGCPFVASYQGGLARASQAVVDFARKSGAIIGKSVQPNPQSNNSQSAIRNAKLNSRQSKESLDANSKPSISFPSPAVLQSAAEMDGLNLRLLGLRAPMTLPYAEYLGEDWSTQGDWLGRFGRARAVLCATNYAAPPKLVISFNFGHIRAFFADIIGSIGPNAPANDSLRHWIHWITTDNPRVLYVPDIGTRRQAEWDDHGEAYPRTHEGPDLWLLVKATERVNRLSLYFYNKDGHKGENRCRDYQIEIYPHKEDKQTSGIEPRGPRIQAGGKTISSDLVAYDGKPAGPTNKFYRLTGLPATALHNSPLARSRIRDFWGGAYKQFILSAYLQIKA